MDTKIYKKNPVNLDWIQSMKINPNLFMVYTTITFLGANSNQ